MNYPVLPPTGGSSRQVAQAVNYLLTNQTAASVPNVLANPLDFGAVGNGLVDDAAAFKAALESGEIIDGLGLTYAFSDEVKPTAINRIQNANLKWISTSAMMAQGKSLLHIQDISNWTAEYLDFDMGTVENTGSEGDNGRNGLTVDTASGTGYNNRVNILNCTGGGKGNGTPFNLRNLKTSRISGNKVHDRRMIMGDAGTADNDAMDGLLFSFCDDCIITDNHVYDQTTSADGGATYTNAFNRGFVFSGVQNSTIANNNARQVDQGFDFSGALTVNGGNSDLDIIGNAGKYCYSWAFKFVHGIKHCSVVACRSLYTGRCGFVFNSDGGYTAAQKTQRLYLTNCHARQGWVQPGLTNAASGQWRGFRFLDDDPTNGPANIRFDGCSAYDDQGYMDYGFFSDNTVDKTSTLYRNCESIGHSAAAFNSNIDAAAWRTL